MRSQCVGLKDREQIEERKPELVSLGEQLRARSQGWKQGAYLSKPGTPQQLEEGVGPASRCVLEASGFPKVLISQVWVGPGACF